MTLDKVKRGLSKLCAIVLIVVVFVFFAVTIKFCAMLYSAEATETQANKRGDFYNLDGTKE